MDAKIPVFTFRRILLSVTIILFAIVFPAQATVPKARRIEAENFFLKSYSELLRCRYDQAVIYLDRALELDTYMVDCYLMKSFSLQRQGRLREACKALRYYLEVRPGDGIVRRMLSHLRQEDRFIDQILSGSLSPATLLISKGTLNQKLGVRGEGIPNSLGIGKGCSIRGTFCLPDTLGNRVRFVSKNGEIFDQAISSPVVARALNEKCFVIFSSDGCAYELSLDKSEQITSLAENNSLLRNVTDAAFLSTKLIAVSVTGTRNIQFLTYPDLTSVSQWVPAHLSCPFEPSSLAVMGGWLAIADRNNGRVYLINGLGDISPASISLNAPRDICWTDTGNLLVLSDDGLLYLIDVNFQKKTMAIRNFIKDIKNGWNLIPAEDRVYCMGASGRSVYTIFAVPPRDYTAGLLTLNKPWIEEKDGEKVLKLIARVRTPFSVPVEADAPVASTVWKGRLLPASLKFIKSIGDVGKKEKDSSILFLSRHDNSKNHAGGITWARNGDDVLRKTFAIWNKRPFQITDIVLDTSIDIDKIFIKQLLGFCLHNGIGLSLWNKKIPPLFLVRASRATGGIQLSAREADLDGFSSSVYPEYIVSIAISEEGLVPGYPSEAMLVAYLDFGMMTTRDWLPIWPDLLY